MEQKLNMSFRKQYINNLLLLIEDTGNRKYLEKLTQLGQFYLLIIAWPTPTQTLAMPLINLFLGKLLLCSSKCIPWTFEQQKTRMLNLNTPSSSWAFPWFSWLKNQRFQRRPKENSVLTNRWFCLPRPKIALGLLIRWSGQWTVAHTRIRRVLGALKKRGSWEKSRWLAKRKKDR